MNSRGNRPFDPVAGVDRRPARRGLACAAGPAGTVARHRVHRSRHCAGGRARCDRGERFPDCPSKGGAPRAAAGVAALAGALLLTWTERKRPEVQEALIGILFVLASTAQILLLANDPHGGDNLKDLLAGQILWVSNDQLIRTAIITAVFALVWFRWRQHVGRIGFYVLFALVVTASVQLVGVYLVFSSLIIPAVASVSACAGQAALAGVCAGGRQLCRGAGGFGGDGFALQSGDRVGDGGAGVAAAFDREKWLHQGVRAGPRTEVEMWLQCPPYAPVAQLDRAPGFETRWSAVRIRPGAPLLLASPLLR